MKPIINKYEHSGPTLSEKEIKDFEDKFEIIIPEQFKSFILEQNGGIPEPSLLIFDNKNNYIFDTETGISPFFDLDEIEYILNQGFIPNGLIPIACDAGDNYICLGVKKNNLNEVYFWLHSDDLLCIFDSFDAFINSFEHREESE